MKASVKYRVIYRHKDKYGISEMCRFFGVSRSGYYDYVKRMDTPAKDARKILKPQMHHRAADAQFFRHLALARQLIPRFQLAGDYFADELLNEKLAQGRSLYPRKLHQSLTSRFWLSYSLFISGLTT